MKIVVIIKQVPEIELVRVDESAGKVALPSGPGVVNPFDEYAIEEGLKIKEQTGGTVIALTVGSERAQSALRQALSVGVDEAVLVTDPAFENSDQQATARILAAAIKNIGDVNLVLAGKQAVDMDAAEVPGALAAFLDWPQVMFVKKTVSVSDQKIEVQRTTEEGYDNVVTPLPAVVSVVKEINEPRLPSLKGKMKAKKAPITQWSAADIGVDAGGVGQSSPSKQLAAMSPPPRQKGEILAGETSEEIVDTLIKKLRDTQVL